MQCILWDRRIVGRMLDHLGVPTPRRVEASRDGGPRIPEGFREHVEGRLGFELPQNVPPAKVQLREDGNAIIVDGVVIEKPFVEKPVSGEDHDVYVYFRDGKGGRKLFRKVGNQSSELDPELIAPRTDKSYIYEEFIDVDNAEDIKVYTVGPGYTHAETRKSPVVDGVVRRNTEGKEIRFITRLTDEEKDYAAKICQGFGQKVCGFDLLRCGNGAKSLVIDVNGWSFVKGNESYYDKAADVLLDISKRLMASPLRALSISEQAKTPEAPSWKLKANVTVFRHADRTPKQKLKYNFPITEPWAQPFVRLLNGEREEIILREREQLETIAAAIEEAKSLGAIGEDLGKLSALNGALFKKIDLPGTKAQLKPGYKKDKSAGTRKLEKLVLVLKWGGEFTHAARYQSRDLGENMRRDISIMNKDCLNNVRIYTSSERRVTASAEIFAAALLTPSPAQQQQQQQQQMSSGLGLNVPPSPGFGASQYTTGGPNVASPTTVSSQIKEQEKHRIIDKIQQRWCCNDEPFLFRERWEKLFEDFCDVKPEKFDPSRISELYDTLKYCALHHRTFLFTVFGESLEAESIEPKDKESPPPKRKLHELYSRAKALFDLVAPQEYGIEPWEKEEIGVLTSLPLLRKIIEDLETARNSGDCSLNLYFTKESHIHTLLNLVLASGLPIANPRIPELDYCSHLTFELYERGTATSKSDREFAIKLSLSEGAHSSNVLDSAIDARHALNVQGRKRLTSHLAYSLVIEKLSKHFSRVPDVGFPAEPQTTIAHGFTGVRNRAGDASEDISTWVYDPSGGQRQ
ncbi:hypothetical protein FRC16_000650 [Serendipita sp. 398]|nr:hypothetical protein FRC16_000650 [Serendipita sp. 398]